MGLTFENMCRQYLLYYAEDLPIAMCDLGQWWGTDRKTRRQVQIDIIGCPAEGSEYIIGSCKYKKEKTGLDELERLRSYAAVFGKGSRYHYYIFSKAGFTEGLENAGAAWRGAACHVGGDVFDELVAFLFINICGML